MSRPEAMVEDEPTRRRFAGRRDRRLWKRYPARAPGVTLTWLEGTTETSIRGILVNIGGEGASFISDVLPPPTVPIWLDLEAAERRDAFAEPVECRLVETADDPNGRKVARIRFVELCPIDLFDLAVHRAE